MIGQQRFNTEVESLLAGWLAKNEEIFRDSLRTKKVGDTDELYNSFRHEIKRLAQGFLEGSHSFAVRGRFVDMGAGRGSDQSLSNKQSYNWTEGRSKGRKPKKWYSPAFYGRLNTLEGAVGLRLMETAIETVKNVVK